MTSKTRDSITSFDKPAAAENPARKGSLFCARVTFKAYRGRDTERRARRMKDIAKRLSGSEVTRSEKCSEFVKTPLGSNR